MNTPPSLLSLEQQFHRQNSEIARLGQLLGALDPRLGLEVDSATLQALEDALEAPPVLPATSLPPGVGLRA